MIGRKIIRMTLGFLLLVLGPSVSVACSGDSPSGSKCYRVCKTGKACGDSCIPKDAQCSSGVGCACNS